MSEKDIFEYRYQIMNDEWKMVEGNLARFDRAVFILRGWVLTLSTASLAFAYSNGEGIICLFLIFPIIGIWVFESLFNMFQHRYINRLKKLEKYMRSAELDQGIINRKFPSFKSPLIAKSILKKRKLSIRLRKLAQSAFRSHIFLFYLFLIILSLGMYCLIGYLESNDFSALVLHSLNSFESCGV